MLLGLTYQLIRLIADLALVRTLSDAIRAEVLALRHQFRVFERRVGETSGVYRSASVRLDAFEAGSA